MWWRFNCVFTGLSLLTFHTTKYICHFLFLQCWKWTEWLVLSTGLPGWCRVPESGNIWERDGVHHYNPARPRQTRTCRSVLQISVERTTSNYAVHQFCTIQYTKQNKLFIQTLNRKKLDQSRNHGKPKTFSLTINLLRNVCVICTLCLSYQSRPKSKTGRS